MVFRPNNEKETQNVKFKGLDSKKDYYIGNEDNKILQKISGESLMKNGLDITLDKIFTSDIFYIQASDVPLDEMNAAWQGFVFNKTSNR